MAKKMYAASAASLAGIFAFWGIFLGTEKRIFFVLGVISMLICYHCTTRLAAGAVMGFIFKDGMGCGGRWFRVRDIEITLYKKLKVKKWKEFVSWDDENSRLKGHTLEEAARLGCRTEVVHEICFVTSLLSIFFAAWFGMLWAFCATAVITAAYDICVVFVQRSDRARIVRIKDRRN